jgi:hypothetical protein
MRRPVLISIAFVVLLGCSILIGWMLPRSPAPLEVVAVPSSCRAVGPVQRPVPKPPLRQAGKSESTYEETPLDPGFFEWVQPGVITHVALKSGRWDDPSVWGGSLPVRGARVLVPEGVRIVMGDVETPHLKALRVDGELEISPDSAAALTVDRLFVNENGALAVGSPDQPLAGDADVLISLEAFVDGGTSGADLANGAQLVSRGSVSMHGAPKTAMVTLGSTPAVGDRELVLSSAPTNWSEGDLIAIGGGRQTRDEMELLRVASVQDTRVKLEAADPTASEWGGLAHDYTPQRDTAAYAVNLSRNVAVSSPPPDADVAREFPQGTMVLEGPAQLNHVSALGLGMEEAILPGYDETVDRAAITFADASGAQVSGLALVDAPEVPIQMQAGSTNVEISDSVALDAFGSGWLTQYGAPSRLIWSGRRTTPSFVGQQ